MSGWGRRCEAGGLKPRARGELKGRVEAGDAGGLVARAGEVVAWGRVDRWGLRSPHRSCRVGGEGGQARGRGGCWGDVERVAVKRAAKAERSCRLESSRRVRREEKGCFAAAGRGVWLPCGREGARVVSSAGVVAGPASCR